METTAHRAVGAATTIVAAHYLPLPPLGVAVSVAAAWVFSGGRTSPDVDNQHLVKTLDRWLPDEWLGHGGPLGHRRLMHWWGLPAAAWLGWHFYPVTLPAIVVWAAEGAWLGWCSHLVGDFVFGQGNRRVGLGRGIPLWPWWGHLGVGFKADGRVERAAWSLATAVAIWAAATFVPALTDYWPNWPNWPNWPGA